MLVAVGARHSDVVGVAFLAVEELVKERDLSFSALLVAILGHCILSLLQAAGEGFSQALFLSS